MMLPVCCYGAQQQLCGSVPPHLLCPSAQVCYGSEGEVRRFEEYM